MKPHWSALAHNTGHRPWPLFCAECTIEYNSLFEAIGLDIDGPARRAHFADAIDVLGWRLQRLG